MSLRPTNISVVPSPSTPFLGRDEVSVSPEWYRFLVKLIAQINGGAAVDPDLMLTAPAGADAAATGELAKRVSMLEVEPSPYAVAVSSAGGAGLVTAAPLTLSTDTTVPAGAVWVICNKGSAQTLTLPSPASPGQTLRLQARSAFGVSSSSSNIVDLDGSATATILLTTVGDWTTLVYDGSAWVRTQYYNNDAITIE